MKIRLMISEDYDAVYQLWADTPGIGLNTTDDSREGICKYLYRNPNTCFVVEEDGDILGAIMSGHDGRRGFIHHTAVKISKRNQGIGSLLVDSAINSLKNKGIYKLALVVFVENETGNTFWENRGFNYREDLRYRNKKIDTVN